MNLLRKCIKLIVVNFICSTNASKTQGIELWGTVGELIIDIYEHLLYVWHSAFMCIVSFSLQNNPYEVGNPTLVR